MPIRVFPPHYQLVYINFDISSFSLISYNTRDGHRKNGRAANQRCLPLAHPARNAIHGDGSRKRRRHPASSDAALLIVAPTLKYKKSRPILIFYATFAYNMTACARFTEQ